MEIRDWVWLLTALVQLQTAIVLNRKEHKKGTKKRRDHRKRK